MPSCATACPSVLPRCPVETVAYGPSPSQVADHVTPGLERANGASVLLIHGGFWRVHYGRDLMAGLAADLSARGYDVWNVEYRRVGEPGGGWPGTFDDVAAAASELAERRAIAIGHSAGGHLALWLAAEGVVSGAVSLAGVCDLEAAHRDGLGGGAAAELLGGSPDEMPGRYEQASPRARLPFRLPQLLVHGDRDDRVPLSQSVEHAAAARAEGDDAELVVVRGVDHFAVIDPNHRAWQPVVDWLARRRSGK
jgi:acetyl esterase/lipase